MATQLKDKDDTFVITSNVDGHFQKSGFAADRVYEVYGTVQKMQCFDCYEVTEIGDFDFKLDDVASKACNIPQCTSCGSNLRPNVQFFHDNHFIADEQEERSESFEEFVKMRKFADKSVTILEIGAGNRMHTLRNLGENLLHRFGDRDSALVRLNLSEECGAESILGPDTFHYVTDKNYMEMMGNEGPITKTEKSELINLQMRAKDGIDSIFKEVQKISGFKATH